MEPEARSVKKSRAVYVQCRRVKLATIRLDKATSPRVFALELRRVARVVCDKTR